MRRALALLTLLPLLAAAEPIDAARRAALVELVRHDCGACHGLTLAGGLGPALTPAALDGKSDESLGFAILHGRRGTPMPPWRAHLSEAEARWIVELLRRGLPR